MDMQISNPQIGIGLNSLVEDIDTKMFTMEFSFQSVVGDRKTLRIPRSATQRPAEIHTALLDAGAELPPDRKDALDLISTAIEKPPTSMYRVTRRAGWRDGSYVAKSGTFGRADGAPRFHSPGSMDASYGMRMGNHAHWYAGLRDAFAASTYLSFAVCLGFAGALLDLLDNDEGAIFNVHTPSSAGKSLMARTLASVAGRAKPSDLSTYDITDRGVEELCFAHNDWAAIFDEEGRAKGGKAQRRERIRSIAFMVPGGRGMTRSEKIAGALNMPNYTWRLFGLSSGEKPLEDEGQRRAAGEQVRHIDIGIPPVEEGGIFDRLSGIRSDRLRQASILAAHVESTIAHHYGVAQEPFLQALVSERTRLEPKIRKLVDRFVREVGADMHPWERRLAMKFAIVAVGGVVAVKAGVLPVTQRHVWECAQSVYRTARRSVFTVEEAADELLNRVRNELGNPKIFPILEKGVCLPADLAETAWGFRRRSAITGELVSILPLQFERLAGSKSAAAAVVSVLLSRGIAVSGSDGKSHRQVAVQGFGLSRSRWVCLRRSAL